ncbi:UDP-N-acetyl-D-galactosamine dehydrogenase [Gracilibacillus halotolerans]|uniref:UDP-N-acetyl-D-galactosamine dehydrogenase n=1 Tax=Gracilibacillus halotolerans TaxID=74386 RepID=A0A841RQ09_9BACI|nr:nucleotide sugar dehydrogenase [Gracilibacillus halotolerans]MBB6513703.1 UDP-N-acetyl-D-galactosamine dehydrogenase [Gracilibacillus halotolerans]
MTDSNQVSIGDTTQKNPPTIGVVGLGYVGLPVAIGFSEKYPIIGFDVDLNRIQELQKSVDRTGEISPDILNSANIEFTNDESRLVQCHLIIVAVPTPVKNNKEPDLTYLEEASKLVGKNLSKGAFVVYESTVYPGTTEEVCLPILEHQSQMKAGTDFYVGYSPERINPGDKEHTFKNNVKVVSGQNEYALQKIYEFYQSVLASNVYKAPSIKVAEASKIVENTQRDINIALMNEFSLIFNALDIDTYEVLNASKTKWNFAPYSPGLVGGHCIGVDPYYLIYKSREVGYDPKLLSLARDLNDSMPTYVVQSLIKLMITHKFNFHETPITVLGITFKENIPDIRNSKSLEIVDELVNLGLQVQVCDPHVESNPFYDNELVDFKRLDELKSTPIIILAVSHQEFKETDWLKRILPNEKGIIMDLKGILSEKLFPDDIVIWKL